MVKRLPEGSTVSTYLLIAQQIASFIVLIPTQFLGNRASRFYPHIIIATLIISLLSCIVLMLWSLKSVNGFSLPFLSMAVVTAVLGYISTTYYLPFTSLYKLYLTNAYTLGLGFSLAFTAILSIIQDSGSDRPRFDHKVFFGIILASQVVSFIGVMWIVLSDGAKSQLQAGQQSDSSLMNNNTNPCPHTIDGLPNQSNKTIPSATNFSSWKVLFHFPWPATWQAALAFLGFGLVPSLLPFASGSYYNGNSVYMWCLTFYIIDPIARAIYSLNIHQFSRQRHVTLLTIICLVFGFLISLLAGMSPNHTWARSSKQGGAIPICLALGFGFFYAAAFTSSYNNAYQLAENATSAEMDGLEVVKEEKKLVAGEGSSDDGHHQSSSSPGQQQQTAGQQRQNHLHHIASDPQIYPSDELQVPLTLSPPIHSLSPQPHEIIEVALSPHQQGNEQIPPSLQPPTTAVAAIPGTDVPTSMTGSSTTNHNDETIQFSPQTRYGSMDDSFETYNQIAKGGVAATATMTTSTTGLTTTTRTPQQCELCRYEAIRREALRQVIYRIAGFALQFGSCIGTFLGASLTVFTDTIPEPVVPKF
jgi:uncharacterized membrane protein YvlD (DUF360 family)